MGFLLWFYFCGLGFSWVVGFFLFCVFVWFDFFFPRCLWLGFVFAVAPWSTWDFWCLRTDFQFGACLLFRSWCADGQCLLQAKLRERAVSSLSLGNLPKAAIIPQFELLELFCLYRFAKHVVKIKLHIFPWDFPGVSETWLLQQKPWSESFRFYCPFGLASFSDTWNLTACLAFPSMISYNNQMRSTVTH